MRNIIVDFEMQPLDRKIYKTEEQLCRSEIIEIGAVVLDEAGKEIDMYKAFVKPQYTKELSAKIIRLTGITQDMVENEEVFEVRINEFASWCCSQGDFTIYAWSDCDLSQVKAELGLKNIKISNAVEKMTKNWKDLQREFDTILGNEHATAVWKALSMIGRRFEGSMHDALVDARNTAVIFNESRDPATLKATAERVRVEEEKAKNIAPSIGSLFDFSKFGFEIEEER